MLKSQAYVHQYMYTYVLMHICFKSGKWTSTYIYTLQYHILWAKIILFCRDSFSLKKLYAYDKLNFKQNATFYVQICPIVSGLVTILLAIIHHQLKQAKLIWNMFGLTCICWSDFPFCIKCTIDGIDIFDTCANDWVCTTLVMAINQTITTGY